MFRYKSVLLLALILASIVASCPMQRCHGGNNCETCTSAKDLVLNEDQLQAKFHALYDSDPDMPHSCAFLQNEGTVCYHDDHLDQMRSQINVNELSQEVC